jgi:hypothetical protein
MIHFACDSCRRIKNLNQIWLLGLAAEAVGLTAARREVTILPAWDNEQAVNPLAVHFCSQRCKDGYVAKLFGQDNTQPELGERRSKRKSETKLVRRKKHSGRGKKAA